MDSQTGSRPISREFPCRKFLSFPRLLSNKTSHIELARNATATSRIAWCFSQAPLKLLRVIGSEKDLSAFIAGFLKGGEPCRINQDVLIACFSPKQDVTYAEQILAFATKHRWQVKIHAPDSRGVVADFCKSP